VTVDGRLLYAELMRLTEGTIADVRPIRNHNLVDYHQHVDYMTLQAQVALYISCITVHYR
jgi:hypothetical protein